VISLIQQSSLRIPLSKLFRKALVVWLAERTRKAALTEFVVMGVDWFDDWEAGLHRDHLAQMFPRAFNDELFEQDIESRDPFSIFEFLTFFAERLKVQQRDAGVRHDLIDAVFALGGEDDLIRLLARVNALQSFVETGEGANLLAGYKRAGNLLKKEQWDTAAASDADVLPDEAALAAALDSAGPTAAKAVEAEDFTAAMSALASLRAPIDAFFDKVTVNDSDHGVRARRLNLLARFRDAVHTVADFSRIEG
jgi:glycyl-tRNA synthetase beta chain